ncbi:hypothetical protein PUN4_160005 [Paraburkholderia unamae]|nr:hypothetical protein PUN4_160005 [Paraburkholderia unamae]
MMTSTFAAGRAAASGLFSLHPTTTANIHNDRHRRTTRFPRVMLFSVIDDLRWTDETKPGARAMAFIAILTWCSIRYYWFSRQRRISVAGNLYAMRQSACARQQ